MEHGGAMAEKLVLSLSAMDAKIEEYESQNLERFETLSDFRISLTNQDSVLEETTHQMKEL